MYRLLLTLLVATAACESEQWTDQGPTALGPARGTIVVTVATRGIPLDADGYIVGVRRGSLAVNLGIAHRVEANGTLVFSDLQPDAYSVWLEDVAPPCTPVVPFDARQIARVFPNTTYAVQLEVNCPASGQGALRVDVSTRAVGFSLSPTASWTVLVDDSPGRPILMNGSIRIDSIAAGPHKVELKAGSCFISASGRPFASITTVTVPIDGTGVASFSVVCIP
jgi:hypothetical protein